LAEEFGKSGEAKFVPITFKKDWEIIRKIDAATNVSYDCK
jgi:phosphonate transport system substrate-binding protein